MQRFNTRVVQYTEDHNTGSTDVYYPLKCIGGSTAHARTNQRLHRCIIQKERSRKKFFNRHEPVPRLVFVMDRSRLKGSAHEPKGKLPCRLEGTLHSPECHARPKTCPPC